MTDVLSWVLDALDWLLVIVTIFFLLYGVRSFLLDLNSLLKKAAKD